MSTAARIARHNCDGSFTSIYCHWDGYPSHTGQILAHSYGSIEQLNELLTLGSISVLRGRVAPQRGELHSFERPLDSVTIAYGRDKGDSGTDSVRSPTFGELSDLTVNCGAGWLYVFRRKGTWFAAKVTSGSVAPLAPISTGLFHARKDSR